MSNSPDNSKDKLKNFFSAAIVLCTVFFWVTALLLILKPIYKTRRNKARLTTTLKDFDAQKTELFSAIGTPLLELSNNKCLDKGEAFSRYYVCVSATSLVYKKATLNNPRAAEIAEFPNSFELRKGIYCKLYRYFADNSYTDRDILKHISASLHQPANYLVIEYSCQINSDTSFYPLKDGVL